ncbi:MAG: HD domain-containing protein [Clostridiales bacterium]|nr:HD domain-containing protein [Clostridiales bacterium]
MSFEEVSQPLLALPEVQQLRRLRHHRHVSRYEHSLRVAEQSFYLAVRLHLDADVCARAGLLHDLFLDNGHWEGWHKVVHLPLAITHPEMAEHNAEALVPLTEKEKNIILSHMWPVTRHWPHSREAWLIVVVDKLVAVQDYLHA